MTTQYIQAGQEAPDNRTQSAHNRYLIGPIADFLCFGGAALFILPLLLMLPTERYQVSVAVLMMLMANAVNHPHFAHSYQIFYRDFSAKAFSRSPGAVLQARYIFAGLIVPALLFGFFTFCFSSNNVQLLGYAANAMALFVGWHYVKQGYGLLMVDCTLKRQFFNVAEKKLLLINSYAVWIAAWMRANDIASKKIMWGIHYYTFDMPAPAIMVALACATGTSLATGWMLFSRWRHAGALPLNGVIAYFVSLYPWLLLIGINPLWGLVVPALHSLQYLAVVWRFQTNYERAHIAQADYKAGSIARQIFAGNPYGYLSLFILTGLIMGFAGFWFLPVALQTLAPPNHAIFGGTAFIFTAWIFINVHHYFIDNVIWRRENRDTKAYLFN